MHGERQLTAYRLWGEMAIASHAAGPSGRYLVRVQDCTEQQSEMKGRPSKSAAQSQASLKGPVISGPGRRQNGRAVGHSAQALRRVPSKKRHAESGPRATEEAKRPSAGWRRSCASVHQNTEKFRLLCAGPLPAAQRVISAAESLRSRGPLHSFTRGCNSHRVGQPSLPAQRMWRAGMTSCLPMSGSSRRR